MSKVKIVRQGNGTQLWVDGKMIASNGTRYTLSQDGCDVPVLEYTSFVNATDLEVELENAIVVENPKYDQFIGE